MLLLAFLVIPALYVGWLSFTTSTYGQDATFVGLANYAQLFGDPIFWRAFWNTFFLVNGDRLRRAGCSASASPCCCPGRVPARR